MTYRAGYIAIIGKPNVGKSTLLNHLIKHKLSITSDKAQTTRHNILGVLTEKTAQFIFIDTPGFQTKYRDALNRVMNQSLFNSLSNADSVLFVIEAGEFNDEDKKIIKFVEESPKPVILVINKTDKLKNQSDLLPFIEKVAKAINFHAIVPVSAKHDRQLADLLKTIEPLLPESAPVFSEDEITDRSEKFLAAELIREKIFRLLGQEIPYSTSVAIESFTIKNNVRHIQAIVIVDKPNHKGMIIGNKGEKLKIISSQARLDMEKLFDGKVFLEVWVKVKKGWADDDSMVKKLGYE